jgi:hypothetical protein
MLVRHLLRLADAPILASHFSTMPMASPARTQCVVSTHLLCLATISGLDVRVVVVALPAGDPDSGIATAEADRDK